MGKLWTEFNERVGQEAELFEPLRSWMEDYFGLASFGETYTRRPTLGLRVYAGHDLYLAVRPGWNPVKNVIFPATTILELIPEGKKPLLTLCCCSLVKLRGSIFKSSDLNEQNLWTMKTIVKKLLLSPEKTIADSAQSGRCVCCRRALTDVISRTRGIGPECVKWYGDLLGSTNHQLTAYRRQHEVEEDKKNYLAETGFICR